MVEGTGLELRNSDFHSVEGGITFNFSITIPDRLLWPFVASVLLYRRARYGYAFRRIPLTQGKYAIVDPEDYGRLSKYKWHLNTAVYTNYACRNIMVGTKKVKIKMHRQILKPPGHLFIDHINHNGLDNRKANLRFATRMQNNCNRIYKKQNSSSRYKGVAWHKHRKKWVARIGINGKRIALGYFDDQVEAAKAYDYAARKYHKEFAVLNFPEP
jgi:hypothetical protein